MADERLAAEGTAVPGAQSGRSADPGGPGGPKEAALERAGRAAGEGEAPPAGAEPAAGLGGSEPERSAVRDDQGVRVLRIERLDRRGFGQAEVERRGRLRPVAVPYTLPGETVRAVLTDWRLKGHRIAAVRTVLERHPARIDPRCPHFGTCGGCTWQHVDYAAQVAFKTERVRDLLEAHGLPTDVVRPAIGMDEPWHYRNKMEFTFAPDGALGLNRLGHYDRPVPLDVCYIAHPHMFRMAAETAAWAREHGLPGYDKRRHEGLLRYLMVRRARSDGAVLVALFAARPPDDPALQAAARDWVARLQAAADDAGFRLAGLYWVAYGGLSDAVGYDDVRLLAGEGFLVDTLGGMRYRLLPQTFFQTNPVQAEALLEAALALAEPEPDMRAIDLFSGVGTFTLPLARKVSAAVGVELVPESVEAAWENARENAVPNVTFLADDVRRGLDRAVEHLGGRVDLLFLDPPRSGAGGKVMRKIGRLGPPVVIYVSCNPETFAPDVRELSAFGYRLVAVQPVDMFPQTAHVELVARLERAGRSSEKTPRNQEPDRS